MSLLPVANFFYNFETKKFQDENGKPIGTGEFTFNAPQWDTPFRKEVMFPVTYLNPRMYATRETAEAVLAWVKKLAPMVTFSIKEEAITGAWVEFPQYSIQAGYSTTEPVERYNAGLLAFSKMTDPIWSERSFRDELRYAGLL